VIEKRGESVARLGEYVTLPPIGASWWLADFPLFAAALQKMNHPPNSPSKSRRGKRQTLRFVQRFLNPNWPLKASHL